MRSGGEWRPAVDDAFARAKDATPENLEITELAIEMAHEWQRGEKSLSAVRRESTGYERFIATNHARGAGKAALMALLDALITEQDRGEGSTQTKQGRFTQRDLEEHGAWIHPDQHGHRVIQFKGLDDDGRTYFRVTPDWKVKEGDTIHGQEEKGHVIQGPWESAS